MSTLIENMIGLVQGGFTPRSVWESTMSLHIGSAAKVNKDTTATEYEKDTKIPLKAGDVVTVVALGAGDSGNDHHVQLADGRQAIVPFYDLGESLVESEDGDDHDGE